MRIAEFPNLLKLHGEEWLRAFASETDLTAFAGWCERCREPQLSGEHCPWCHVPLVKLDSEFWQKVGQKIRLALVKNHSLLPEVKTSWISVYGVRHHPKFPAELEWLRCAWAWAGQPPHRPFDPKVHYDVANWVRSLQQLGLSHEEVIDVMNGTFEDDHRDGPITLGKKDYANMPVQDLRMLRHKFMEITGYVPGSMLNREEMWRTLEWVDRQRANPMARLKGERVRNRSADHGLGGQSTEKKK